MKNPIELKKAYLLTDDYNSIKTNHREQILLLYTLHQLTGLLGTQLIENYINLIIPITKKNGEQGYTVVTSHRAKRRKHLNYLLNNHLTIN